MEYTNDLNEIVALINASIDDNKEFDSEYCLDRLTKQIDEEYLMSRANNILKTYATDKKFAASIKKLSSICNESFCDCKNCSVKKYCNYNNHSNHRAGSRK